MAEKVKAYDKAFGRAKALYAKGAPDSLHLEEMFPELKESEDDEIIKWIIDDIRYNMINDPLNNSEYKKKAENAISWLEKQGQTFFTKKDVDDAYLKGVCAAKSELEKQCEQNPADNVEPKFQNGQWIVWQNKCYKVNYNGCGYELIGQNGLTTSLEYGTVDENAHLWTIQDAKNGEVLVGKIDGDSYILIYNQIKDGWVETYGHYYNAVDRFCVPSQLFCRDCNGTFYPAAKEQRDLLFQKVKEAGYEWNYWKKELRKINSYCQEHCKGYQETGRCFFDGGCQAKREAEQNISNPTKTCNDEEKVNDIYPIFRVGDSIINKKTSDKALIEQLDIATKAYCYVSHDGAAVNHSDFPFSQQDEWELIGQKVVEQSALSEEDERLCSCLIEEQEESLDNVKNDKYGHSEIISDLKEMYNERIAWLESIKDRVKPQWKPSYEEINALEHFVRSVGESGFASPSDNNTKCVYSLLNNLKKL